MKMKNNKRGLSPVIATVLLISLVIVLGLIILLWARGFISEVVEKEGKPANQVCGEVDLQASLSGTSLSLVNRGNIPIYDLEIREKSIGRVDVKRASMEYTEQWNALGESGLGEGESVTLPSIAEETEIVPVILGEADNKQRLYACVDNQVTPE